MDIKLELIDNIVKDLYYEVNGETWDKLNELFENIEKILTCISNIEEKDEVLVGIFTRLMESVKSLAQVIDSGDRTLLADILIYDLKPLYESLDKI